MQYACIFHLIEMNARFEELINIEAHYYYFFANFHFFLV